MAIDRGIAAHESVLVAAHAGPNLGHRHTEPQPLNLNRAFSAMMIGRVRTHSGE